MTTETLLKRFAILRTDNGGIESFVSPNSPELVLKTLAGLDQNQLSKVQLNQLLGLCEERAVSDGFFEYYWLREPRCPYKLSSIPGFSTEYAKCDKIRSIDHLLYGLHRIYIDGLLYRGNVRSYFRETSNSSFNDLNNSVERRLVDTASIKRRGPTLPLHNISRDHRYLISEMACKSYGNTAKTKSELKTALLEAWTKHQKEGGKAITVKALLLGTKDPKEYSHEQKLFAFSAVEMLEDSISSTAQLTERYEAIADAFIKARYAALENTRLYLSLVNDLDVYVATSMRDRQDFRMMASRCEEVFENPKLRDLHLRYFDPTLSAADGHQDKGLIECLMVKCAKVLVFCAGEKDSFGKDAEAAMALSLGKPVIFLCDESERLEFYRQVHPLSRLINFGNGVAVGAMVTTKVSVVSELLQRIFENEMEYALQQREGMEKPGYLQLVEKLTDSVVRLQTNDTLLAEAFWNYYNTQSS